MGFLLLGGGCGYRYATLTKVWVALPCGRNLSSVDIAKYDPKFSGCKKTLKIGKNIRNAVVLVWGRQTLKNSS